jgi:transposase InsO family protein
MKIPIAWPFAQWRLDQVGPMPKSLPGWHTYLLVAVDKFTKWIEAIPVTNQTAAAAIKFFCGITCRFGVPHNIITDNISNFSSYEFHIFCEKLGIKLSFASVSHTQTNGQVERINGLICDGIKKRPRKAVGVCGSNSHHQYFGACVPHHTDDAIYSFLSGTWSQSYSAC